MVSALFVFLLFFLPLVVFPLKIGFFEAPKVILFELAVEYMAVLFIWRHRTTPFRFSVSYVPYLILIVLSLLHFFFLPTSTTLFGNPFRLQGIFLLWHLLVFSVMVGRMPVSIHRYIPAAALVLLFCSVPFFGINKASRFIGTLGEPNALATAVLFYLPWIVVAKQPLSLLKKIAIGAGIIILIASSSVSGTIGASIAFMYFFLAKKTSRENALIVCILAILVSMALPVFEKRVYEDRTQVWNTAWHAGLSSPIIGNGFGNIEHAMKRTSEMLGNTVQYQYVDSSHNLFLDMWVAGGIVGLGAFMFLVVTSFQTLVATHDDTKLMILLGLITALSFNPASVAALVWLWWVIGSGATTSLNRP